MATFRLKHILIAFVLAVILFTVSFYPVYLITGSWMFAGLIATVVLSTVDVLWRHYQSYKKMRIAAKKAS